MHGNDDQPVVSMQISEQDGERTGSIEVQPPAMDVKRAANDGSSRAPKLDRTALARGLDAVCLGQDAGWGSFPKQQSSQKGET
jgi:hypothetical protein